MLRLRSPQDLVAGLCTILVAALALWEIRDLRTGTIFRMGPGYIPLVLASIVAGLGTIITASAFALDGARLERWGWRSIVIVGAAILFFAVAIESLGLFVTTAVLTLGASFAEPHNRFASALAFALAYAIFVVLVFPLALRVGVPVWPRL